MGYKDRFINDYFDPLRVQTTVRGLAEKFPDLCRLEDLPFKSHGYWGVKEEIHGPQTMSVLRITGPKRDKTKPGVLLMRSQHAREWINAIAVVEAACQLAENYRSDDSDSRVQRVVTLLDEVEFFIVPEGNPDGACQSFFDEGWNMWRKNMRPPAPSGTCPGVDCNRNFPKYWGEAGSSSDACTEIFRGPSMLSEPENRNIDHLVRANRNIIFAIDSHSYGQDMFRPHPKGGRFVSHLPVSEEDHRTYTHLETLMNRNIRLVQGIEYSTGSTSNHAGTTDEYLFFDHCIFCFDLECGRDFQPTVSAALLSAAEVVQATLALGWCATGRTGLDIDSLLARRAEVPADFAPAIEVVEEALVPYRPPALAWEEQRRYHVELAPLRAGKGEDEARELHEQRFDVIDRSADRVEIIVSIKDVDALLQSGYRPRVLRSFSRSVLL